MRLPQLHDDLVRAAAQRARRRRMVGPRTLLLAAALMLTIGGTAAALLSGAVGGRPTLFPLDEGPAPEPHLEVTRGKVVLAVGRLPRSGRWELVGHRYRDRGSTGPDAVCLDVVLVERGWSHGCNDASTRIQGIGGGMDTLQLTGATTHMEVERVRVQFRAAAEAGVRDASLVKVPGDVAELVGIGHPFAFYVAELPRGARDFIVEALDGGGRRLWQARRP